MALTTDHLQTQFSPKKKISHIKNKKNITNFHYDELRCSFRKWFYKIFENYTKTSHGDYPWHTSNGMRLFIPIFGLFVRMGHADFGLLKKGVLCRLQIKIIMAAGAEQWRCAIATVFEETYECGLLFFFLFRFTFCEIQTIFEVCLVWRFPNCTLPKSNVNFSYAIVRFRYVSLTMCDYNKLFSY